MAKAKLWTHCDFRPGEPARKVAWGVGRRRNMDRIQYADGRTYDAYPNLLTPYTAPALAPSAVDVGTVTEYGLTQRLSKPIRCF